jgi:hypothetical protein
VGPFIEVTACLRRIWVGVATYDGGLTEAAAHEPWRHGLFCGGAEQLWWLMAWSRLERRRWWWVARSGGILRRCRHPCSNVVVAVSTLFELFHQRLQAVVGGSVLPRYGLRQGGWRRGRRWLAEGWWSSEPTLPGLSSM